MRLKTSNIPFNHIHGKRSCSLSGRNYDHPHLPLNELRVVKRVPSWSPAGHVKSGSFWSCEERLLLLYFPALSAAMIAAHYNSGPPRKMLCFHHVCACVRVCVFSSMCLSNHHTFVRQSVPASPDFVCLSVTSIT